MNGRWKATGPGKGTWTTDGGLEPLAYVAVGVFGAAGLAAAVWRAVLRERTQLELIFTAAAGFLVLAVTVVVLAYRWTHPRVALAGEQPALPGAASAALPAAGQVAVLVEGRTPQEMQVAFLSRAQARQLAAEGRFAVVDPAVVAALRSTARREIGGPQ